LHLNIELESEGGGVVAWTVIRRGAAGRDGGSEAVEVAPAPYCLHNNGALLQSPLKYYAINEVFLMFHPLLAQ
jgi:hypothetical protein